MKNIRKWNCIILCLIMLIGFTGETEMRVRADSGSEITTQVQSGYTGWKTIKGKKKYYLNGRKLKGFRRIGESYYYLDSKGNMKTGWQFVKNHYRYFDKKTGKMKTNTRVQGRKINSSGIWTPVVVLDPGHSGVVASGYEPLWPGSSERKARDNSGTEGVATRVPEYRLTLTIAKKLRTELKKQGCKVILTRKDNKTPKSCVQRAKTANRAKADAYLRIHANGADSSSATGAMTICVTRKNPAVSAKMYKKSYALSKAVLNSYVKATGCRREYIWETDSMSGNNWSKVPTTLIEMGYMSNPSEDRLMQKASYQKKMVKGMADGLRTYFLRQ